MKSKRREYRFDTPAEVARYHRDMKAALAKVEINRPYGRPLIPIKQLDVWHGRALAKYGMEGGVS